MSEEKKFMMEEKKFIQNEDTSLVTRVIDYCKQNSNTMMYIFLLCLIGFGTLYLLSHYKHKWKKHIVEPEEPSVEKPNVEKPNIPQPVLLPKTSSCKRYEVI